MHLHAAMIGLLLLLLLFSNQNLLPKTRAIDTLTSGQSLPWNQTLVSKGGNFELGFFSPGNSKRHYIGIWFKNISKQTVVWVANRERPALEPSACRLTLTDRGELVLLAAPSNTSLWSSSNATSPSPRTAAAVATLQDDGNLVVRSGGATASSSSSTVTWQSFDHPTDTWLPGANLGYDRARGVHSFLTSWTDAEDPAPGAFSMVMDPNGHTKLYLLAGGEHQYWTTGLWDGEIFSNLPEMRSGYFAGVPYAPNAGVNFFSYHDRVPLGIRNFVLDVNGQMHRRQWSDTAGEWNLFCSEPHDACHVPGACGPYAVCSNATSPACRCPAGFAPRLEGQWRLGNTASGCERRRQSPQEGVAAASEEHSSKKSVLMIHGGVVAAAVLLLASLVVAGSVVVILRRWRGKGKVAAAAAAEGSLMVFDYRALKEATRDFSEKLGSGGFGSVFKGALPDATPVAVKKLDGWRQGEKQFRAEVLTLGMIHHVNLVRLRGFCSEKNKRALVYDYMPNGSLDSHLFKNSSSSSSTKEALSWGQRFGIAVGVARGLAYLHEKCRECIIHCDVKPENVLLDGALRPKLADFGMAKLVGRDASRVLTTVRGTPGYLAPEWLAGDPVTAKADVYSFGLVLLELVSGRRNAASWEGGGGGSAMYFPVRAAVRLRAGDVAGLLDGRLSGDANVVELDRLCRVACWCIQDEEGDRPAMGLAVQQLEGVVDVGLPPVPARLHMLAMVNGCASGVAKDKKLYSENSCTLLAGEVHKP